MADDIRRLVVRKPSFAEGVSCYCPVPVAPFTRGTYIGDVQEAHLGNKYVDYVQTFKSILALLSSQRNHKVSAGHSHIFVYGGCEDCFSLVGALTEEPRELLREFAYFNEC